MGYSILEMVLRRLRQGRFSASVAFPGQKFPQITETVAAVHIEKVDRANLAVTVEVNIICPASMGGTACEMEALRATEILRWSGAVCIQNGCSYDGVAQVYVVQILATYSGITEADDCKIWPGFYCYVNDIERLFAVSVGTEYRNEAREEFVMGESLPAASSLGKRSWEIRLEELVPVGSPEPEEDDQEFILQVDTEGKSECFTGCRWTSVKREMGPRGVHRVLTGFARDREVTPT